MEKISITSINKYNMIYSSLMKWAEKLGYAKNNPFEGIRLKAPKGQRRRDFSSHEMEAIVAALHKQRASGELQDYRYWGALLAMYTGARLNEVASLTCDDVKCEEGTWYFDINDEEETKSLKTEAAKRKVPVHPDLIEYGFLIFLDEAKRKRKQGERLFEG